MLKRSISAIVIAAFLLTQCGLGIAAPIYNKVGRNLRGTNVGQNPDEAKVVGNEIKTAAAATGNVDDAMNFINDALSKGNSADTLLVVVRDRNGDIALKIQIFYNVTSSNAERNAENLRRIEQIRNKLVELSSYSNRFSFNVELGGRVGIWQQAAAKPAVVGLPGPSQNEITGIGRQASRGALGAAAGNGAVNAAAEIKCKFYDIEMPILKSGRPHLSSAIINLRGKRFSLYDVEAITLTVASPGTGEKLAELLRMVHQVCPPDSNKGVSVIFRQGGELSEPFKLSDISGKLKHKFDTEKRTTITPTTIDILGQTIDLSKVDAVEFEITKPNGISLQMLLEKVYEGYPRDADVKADIDVDFVMAPATAAATGAANAAAAGLAEIYDKAETMAQSVQAFFEVGGNPTLEEVKGMSMAEINSYVSYIQGLVAAQPAASEVEMRASAVNGNEAAQIAAAKKAIAIASAEQLQALRDKLAPRFEKGGFAVVVSEDPNEIDEIYVRLTDPENGLGLSLADIKSFTSSKAAEDFIREHQGEILLVINRIKGAMAEFEKLLPDYEIAGGVLSVIPETARDINDCV